LATAGPQESYGGEDAWFESDVGGGALGVADGVGGWADSEINPAGAALSHRHSVILPLHAACAGDDTGTSRCFMPELHQASGIEPCAARAPSNVAATPRTVLLH